MTSTSTPLDAIEKTVELDHPIERVWRAVTEPEELAAWFPNHDATLEVRPGGTGRFEWRFGEGDDAERHTSTVTVHAVEAPTRFVWSWRNADRSDAVETEVEFLLTARPDGGTTLLVRETGFLDPAARADNVGGWDAETDELIEYLQGEAA